MKTEAIKKYLMEQVEKLEDKDIEEHFEPVLCQKNVRVTLGKGIFIVNVSSLPKDLQGE